MKRSALFGWSLCLLWGFLAVSCVEQEYAMDDIDMTVNVGGDSLALPLGVTDTIYAKSLLDGAGDAQDFLTALEDGTLAITQAGGMDMAVPEVDAGGLMMSDFTGGSDNILTFASARAGAAVKSIGLSAPVTDALPVETGLDDIAPEIERIDYIAMATGAVLDFTFEVPDLKRYPDLDVRMEMSVALPDFVRPDATVTLEDGKLRIHGKLEGGRLTYRMPIAGLNLSQFPVADGHLELTGEMHYSGLFILVLDEAAQLADWEGKTMSLHTGYEVTHLTPVRFEGLFEPNIDPIQETVAFGDIPEMLTGEDMIFDFYAPYLLLSVPTNLGIALQNELTVTPVVQGTPQADKAAKAQLLLPARPDAKMDTTRYYLANRQPATLPAGYTFVECDLASLLRRIPEALQIELTTVADHRSEMVYDFSVTYTAAADYDFIVPMSFGQDLHLSLGDTIDGLPDLVNEILSKNELHIGGTALNTMPVDLELFLTALDADGREVPMETAPQRILAGTQEGAAVVTPLDLTLGDRTGAADKQPVKALVLRFTLTTGAGNEGVPLKTTSWVRAALKARIPGGITVDLRDLNEAE